MLFLYVVTAWSPYVGGLLLGRRRWAEPGYVLLMVLQRQSASPRVDSTEARFAAARPAIDVSRYAGGERGRCDAALVSLLCRRIMTSYSHAGCREIPSCSSPTAESDCRHIPVCSRFPPDTLCAHLCRSGKDAIAPQPKDYLCIRVRASRRLPRESACIRAKRALVNVVEEPLAATQWPSHQPAAMQQFSALAVIQLGWNVGESSSRRRCHRQRREDIPTAN